MVEDFTINKQILIKYVEDKFDGGVLGPKQQDKYKFSTGSSYVKIKEPFAINQNAESLYRTARDNHRYLNQTEHDVVNQNTTIIDVFGESVAVIFQPVLQELDRSMREEAAVYFLEAAEDDILLDPMVGNLGTRKGSDMIEYLDTGDSASVMIPENESFGAVSNFGQDRVDFDLLIGTYLARTVDSSFERGFDKVLEEVATEKYDEEHRLHP